MKEIPIAIALITASCLCVTAQAENLIVNGGFERPDAPRPRGYTLLEAGDGSLTGWTIADSNQQTGIGGVTLIDHWDLSPQDTTTDVVALPSEGQQFLQLQEHISKDSGIISQSFNTAIGQHYVLQFDYTALDFQSRPIILKYCVGGAEQTVQFSSLPYQQVPWGTHTFKFEAIASVTTLSFEGQFFSGFWGPGIDNVRVSIPEPQTCALLGGLLALTCIARRRP